MYCIKLHINIALTWEICIGGRNCPTKNVDSGEERSKKNEKSTHLLDDVHVLHKAYNFIYIIAL